MGDAAFLLLSKEPITGFQIFCIAGLTGMVTGYIVDFLITQNISKLTKTSKLSLKILKKLLFQNLMFFWLIVFCPGFIIGVLLIFQVNLDTLILFKNFSLVQSVGSIGAIIFIFMWTLNPLSDFQCSTEKTRSFLSRVIDTTNFVTTWVVCGFLIYEIFMYLTGIDLKNIF